MTELRINKGTDASPMWEAVDLTKDFRATINYDNVIYTKSSEYTYDFEIPMSSSKNNVRIFGPIHRRDSTKRGDTFRCILIVDNRTIIDNGISVITSVSADSITLQAMGGNSEVNFRSRLDGMYIDKIDLGNAVQDINSFHQKYGLLPCAQTLSAFREWVQWASTQPMVTRQDTAQNESDETNLLADVVMRRYEDFPFVMLPSLDTDSGALVNRYGVKVSDNYFAFHKYPQPYFDQMGIDTSGDGTYFMKYENVVYCPQPYLIFIIEKVIKYLGYDVSLDTLRTSLFNKIYIVNTTNTIEYAKMLPHWTVNEFLTEVENFFNCVFVFGENRKAQILSRSEYFSMNDANYIEHAIDSSFNVDTQSDELEEVNTSNIIFDGNNNKFHHFDEKILEHSKFVTTSNPNTYFEQFTDDEKYSIVACAPDGKRYICLQSLDPDQEEDRVIEADQLRELSRGDDAETTTLKICPAEIKVEYMSFFQTSPLKVNSQYLIPMPCAEAMPLETKLINISKYIRGTEDFEDGNSGDLMRIALFDGIDNVYEFTSSKVGPGSSRGLQTKNIPVFTGWTYGPEDLYTIWTDYNRSWLDDVNIPEKSELLRTADISGRNTIGNYFHADSQDESHQVNIDSEAQLEVQFTDDHLKFDLRKPFVIAGKKYICLSISASISATGFEKIKTGIFFPFDNE